jgi:hypothetical protein
MSFDFDAVAFGAGVISTADVVQVQLKNVGNRPIDADSR